MPIFSRPTVTLALICIAIGAYAMWIYASGAHGPFLFDDWANLPALTAQGSLEQADNFLRYITSSKADPTGRPIAMLAFALNAPDWPANPAAFKWTNIALHALNAVMLTVVLYRLCLSLGMSVARSHTASAIAALAWGIHPLLVSTVLYAVQREALLAGTFILLGLLCWLNGRARMLKGAPGGALWLVAGVGLCTLLGCLSKANGVLLPLLILVTESVLPPSENHNQRHYKRVLLLSCGPIASIILIALVALAIKSIGEGFLPYRGWSIGQRLLTEPAILWDYAFQLLLLKPVASSVFHDQYEAARSAFDPWYVIPAVMAWIALAMVSWRLRRRYPSVSLAILFFLAAHCLESSSISLELYFEHRNYVPAMFLFLPLGTALTSLGRRSVGIALAVVVLGAMSVLTRIEANRWSDPKGQAEIWAAMQPDSPRAQAYAAQVESAYGRNDQAVRRLAIARKRFPDEPQVAFNVVNAACRSGHVSAIDREAALTAVRTSRKDPGALLLQWVDATLEAVAAQQCPGLDLPFISSLLDTAISNPAIASVPGRRQDIFHLRGEIALAQKRPDAALTWFNTALAQAPTPQAALAQAAELGAQGWPAHGVRHLDAYESMQTAPTPSWTSGMPWVHARLLRAQDYWPTELTNLRTALTDASTKARNAAN
ncbi:tetratricopeptide repeat protein [Luteibacter sp.]|uniref:tetratricopeptide repeat protein n=1 Tax=Luteibacter sp. TaxID=1886636 RepID=UPI003F7FCC14